MSLGSIALAAAVRLPLVVHGSDDAADPAVVAIVDANGFTTCSGTIIAPHFVLTAAHCIEPDIAYGANVLIGAGVAAPTASIPITGSRVHPAYDSTSYANDAAILVLAAAAPVTPASLGQVAPGVGSSVRLVGWGETSSKAGDFGTKRSGTSLVTGVDALSFTIGPDPSLPCAGDSGGPAFATQGGVEAVVGITSHGDLACASNAAYTRVDAVTSDFISPTLATLGDGTLSAGSPCAFAEQCIGSAATCVVASDNPNIRYCTAGCEVHADCPARMLCVSVGDADSQCRYPIPTPGALGAACSGDSDCVDGACTSLGACGVRCVPDGASCPATSQCANTGGIDFFCVLLPPPTATGSSCALARGAGGVSFATLLPVVVALARWRRRAQRHAFGSQRDASVTPGSRPIAESAARERAISSA